MPASAMVLPTLASKGTSQKSRSLEPPSPLSEAEGFAFTLTARVGRRAPHHPRRCSVLDLIPVPRSTLRGGGEVPSKAMGVSGGPEPTSGGEEPSRGQPSEAGKGARGLVVVNTGDGKGKTTAALGILMRAWGQGLRVVMLQFVKSRDGGWGELEAARRLGVEVVPLGDGFTWGSADLEGDRALARECWDRCRAAIEGGEYDVVIADEMTYCLTFGWLDVEEVLGVLRHRPAGEHVVITGRHAPRSLVEFADLVTEMREVKHPYRSGVTAQRGIEF